MVLATACGPDNRYAPFPLFHAVAYGLCLVVALLLAYYVQQMCIFLAVLFAYGIPVAHNGVGYMPGGYVAVGSTVAAYYVRRIVQYLQRLLGGGVLAACHNNGIKNIILHSASVFSI